MTMIRRPSTFGELVSLRRTMDRLFDDAFFRHRALEAPWPAADAAGRHSTRRTPIILEAALPGIRPEDVEVTVLEDTLTVIAGKEQASARPGEGERVPGARGPPQPRQPHADPALRAGHGRRDRAPSRTACCAWPSPRRAGPAAPDDPRHDAGHSRPSRPRPSRPRPRPPRPRTPRRPTRPRTPDDQPWNVSGRSGPTSSGRQPAGLRHQRGRRAGARPSADAAHLRGRGAALPRPHPHQHPSLLGE